MRQLVVYGKSGCSKCESLQKRLDKLNIPFVLRKVDTIDGMVRFCRAEQLNPSCIPSLIVEQSVNGVVKPLCDTPSKLKELFGSNCLATIVGMQTDYDSGGVLHPQMLAQLSGYLE